MLALGTISTGFISILPVVSCNKKEQKENKGNLTCDFVSAFKNFKYIKNHIPGLTFEKEPKKPEIKKDDIIIEVYQEGIKKDNNEFFELYSDFSYYYLYELRFHINPYLYEKDTFIDIVFKAKDRTINGLEEHHQVVQLHDKTMINTILWTSEEKIINDENKFQKNDVTKISLQTGDYQKKVKEDSIPIKIKDVTVMVEINKREVQAWSEHNWFFDFTLEENKMKFTFKDYLAIFERNNLTSPSSFKVRLAYIGFDAETFQPILYEDESFVIQLVTA